MIKNHPFFIFTPGRWCGKGVLTVMSMNQTVNYTTVWTITEPDEDGNIACLQEVRIEGMNDVAQNAYLFRPALDGHFDIYLDSAAAGLLQGKGIITDTIIGWEFAQTGAKYESIEFYERGEDGQFKLCVESATDPFFRTTMRGEIWRDLDEK